MQVEDIVLGLIFKFIVLLIVINSKKLDFLDFAEENHQETLKRKATFSELGVFKAVKIQVS